MAFKYTPSPTGLALHNCAKYLKMLCGPYGSGKSCACAMDVFMTAAAQTPAPDGVRYCRVGVVRSSYPELQSATRRSLLEVLPGECGTIVSTGSPMRGLYRIPLPDNTILQLELELWALLSEDDGEKIKSANWSFAWVNEATGCAPAIYTAITSRIGRFPPQDMGGTTWAGVIMDFNQPVPGTWLDDFIKNPQPNWAVFLQPPAAFKKEDDQGNTIYEINPNAENLRNLGAYEEGDPPDFTPEQKGMRYYRNQIEALVRTGRYDIIDNQYCLIDVPIIDGKPVYSNFSKSRHVAPRVLAPAVLREIIVALDQSGVHPAAVILQEQDSGQWGVLDELYMDGEGFEVFLQSGLIPLLRNKYPNNPVYVVIDPSNQRDSWQGITPKERLAEYGLNAVTEISNSPKARIQCVEHMLNLYAGGLLVSPACEMLIRGFVSEYRYRKVRAVGTVGAIYTAQPDKNEYSHVQDALGYAALFIQKGLAKDSNVDYRKMSDTVQRHRQKLMRVV